MLAVRPATPDLEQIHIVVLLNVMAQTSSIKLCIHACMHVVKFYIIARPYDLFLQYLHVIINNRHTNLHYKPVGHNPNFHVKLLLCMEI